MDVRKFVSFKNDTCVITACIELVAFSSESVEKGAGGFSTFFSVFRTRFGNELKLYNTANMKRMQAVDRNALEMVPSWFSGRRGVPTGNLSFYSHSGPKSQDSKPPAFEMFCDRTSDVPNAFFRIVLPVDWIKSDPQAFLKLAQSALAGFPLLSGYAGYSLYWQSLDPEMTAMAAKQYKPWLKRHPGFVHGDPMEFAETALFGIVTVDWLTLLGPSFEEKLGGATKIRAVLGPDMTVSPIDKGLVLQAGLLPQIGDINRNDRLPLYQKVARLLKGLRAPADEAWIEGFTAEETEEWFARFD
jgi:hypothetical protein